MEGGRAQQREIVAHPALNLIADAVIARISMTSRALREWLENPSLPPIHFMGDGGPSFTWSPRRESDPTIAGEPPWRQGTYFVFLGTFNLGIIAHELGHIWIRDNGPDEATHDLNEEKRADALACEWGSAASF